MTHPPCPQQTADRLQNLLKQRRLPHAARDIARKVVARLQKPMQVTLVGHSGTDQARLLNILLQDAIVRPLETDVLRLVHGPEPRGATHLNNGVLNAFEGVIWDQSIPDGTTEIVQHLPLAALTDIRFMAVQLPQHPHARNTLLDRVAAESDAVVWCTPKLDPEHAELWSRMPDPLKDRSFLALLNADASQHAVHLAQASAAFEAHFAQEFFALHPIAVHAALSALNSGQGADPQLWAASGAQALCTALTDHATATRSADLDLARLLLAKYDTQDETAPTVPAAETAPVAVATTHQPNAVDTAFQILNSCVEAMQVPEPTPQFLLEQARLGAQALANKVTDTDKDNPHWTSLHHMIRETEQRMQLWHQAGTEKAAVDAIGALLQVKKEMSGVVYG